MPTSKLQQSLSHLLFTKFAQVTELYENARPEWLTDPLSGNRLELDFYLPSIKLGVEVQGIQHYEFCPLFHRDINDFYEQKRRDAAKKSLCDSCGLTLIELSSSDEVTDVIETINSRLMLSEILETEIAAISIPNIDWQKVRDRLINRYTSFLVRQHGKTLTRLRKKLDRTRFAYEMVLLSAKAQHHIAPTLAAVQQIEAKIARIESLFDEAKYRIVVELAQRYYRGIQA
jgi:hypothetical protein